MKKIFSVFILTIINLSILLLFACKNDDSMILESETVAFKSLDISAQILHGEDFLQSNKNLDTFIRKRFNNNLQFSSESDVTNPDGFTVLTDRFLEISGSTYTNYIFNIIRETPSNEGFENYMLTLFNDGSYMQVLVYYPFIETDEGFIADVNNATITYINDASLLTGIESSPCPSTSQEIIAWEEECVAVNCGDIGNHSPGEACDNGEYVAYWNCTGAWVVTGCVYTSGGTNTSSGSDPSNSTTNGGNATNPVDPNTNEEVPTVPFIDLLDESIKNRLKEISDKQIIKDKLSQLGQKIFNPNHHTEDGAIYKQLSDGSLEERLPSSTTGLETIFDPEFITGETVSLHMHPQKAWDYSGPAPELKEVSPIFSKSDVYNFLRFRKFRKDTDENITGNDDNNIVAMLASEEGVFALVVEDAQKMDDALTALGDDPENNPTEAWEKYKDKFTELVLDGCDNENACIIKAFADFIDDYKINSQNLGIRVYQGIIINGEITRWKRL